MHRHTAGTPTPPQGAIAALPSFETGYTGTDGKSSPIHVRAGQYAGTIDVFLHADINGRSLDSQHVFGAGFPWLRESSFTPV